MKREPKYNGLQVFKSNDLVAMSTGFTPIEQKIVFTAIAQHRKTDTDFFEYTFEAKELSSLFNIEMKHIYSYLEDASKLLSTRSLGYSNPIKEEFAYYPLMKSVKYETGSLTVKFNSDLTPLLLDIGKQYTILELDTIVKLKKTHSMRIYELISKGHNKNHKSGVWVETYRNIDDFKELLNLFTETKGTKKKPSVKTYKYPRFGDFNTKVLSPSIKEINEKTDINITLGTIKKSNKVVGITFDVKRQGMKMDRSDLSEEDKIIIAIENKLKRASNKSLEAFNVILKDKENQPNMFITDPELKKEYDRISALKEWDKI